MTAYLNIAGTSAREQERAFLTATRTPAPVAPPPVLIRPRPTTTAMAPSSPAAAPKPGGCKGCGGAPAPSAAPAAAPASSGPTVSMAPFMPGPGAAAPVLKAAEPAKPRDPRELLAWIEENGGIALWVILALVVLSVMSRKGGGGKTW